ncbi:MAG: PKD-like family lipoprotein [Marinifilaceae bacterium]
MFRLITFAFILGFLHVACHEDIGNYEYKEINTVEISTIGFADTTYIVCSGVDTLRIHPEVTASMDNNHDRYRYEWILMANMYVNQPTVITIDSTPNLCYPVSLLSTEYTLYYRITDKQTTLQYTQQTKVSVRDRLTEGWLLLGEDEHNNVQVDMISLAIDTVILRDVCRNTGLPTLKNPILIHAIKGVTNHGIYVGAEESYVLRRKNHETANSEMPIDNENFLNQGYAGILKQQFHIPPTEKLVINDIMQMGMLYRVMIMNGNLHFMSLFDLDLRFSNEINHYKNSHSLFEIGDRVAYPTMGISNNIILYNKSQKRFVYVNSNNATYCDSLKDTQSDIDIFSWQTGLEFVTTINSYYKGYSYTVLKDEHIQQYYLYIYLVGRTNTKIKTYKINNALNLNKNSKIFGISANYPYMLYTTNNIVYAYDYVADVSKPILEFGNDEITLAYYDIRCEPTKDVFYVATYNDADKGRIRKYHLMEINNTIKVEQLRGTDWKGLCKIKSMDYKFNANAIQAD